MGHNTIAMEITNSNRRDNHDEKLNNVNKGSTVIESRHYYN